MKRIMMAGIVAGMMAVSGYGMMSMKEADEPDFWFVVNEDNDHFFKCPSSEMTREGLVRYADYIARGKVTHVFLCVNGQRTSYDSKTWEPIWKGINEKARQDTATWPDGTHDRWAVNAKILFDAGIDPYDVWIKRFREKGVRPWVSMRMNDVHFGGDPKYFRNTTFFKSHPEYRLIPGQMWNGSQMNFAIKEVRDYTMAQVREIAERWDSDGVELDWMRFGNAFKDKEARQNAPILDAFMKEARETVNAAGRKHGRKMKLAVRVPPTIASGEERGFNAVKWAKEGLVDVIVPDTFIEPMTDLPVAEWLEAVKGTGVMILPGTGSVAPHQVNGSKNIIKAHRGMAAWRHRQGAKGVYFFNLPYWSNKLYSTDGGGSDTDDIAATLYAEGVAPTDTATREKAYIYSDGDILPVPTRSFDVTDWPAEGYALVNETAAPYTARIVIKDPKRTKPMRVTGTYVNLFGEQVEVFPYSVCPKNGILQMTIPPKGKLVVGGREARK